MNNVKKFSLLVILSTFALVACDKLADYANARKAMNESYAKIEAVLRGGHIESTEPYVPARVIFELGNYNKACADALSATEETANHYTSMKPNNEERSALVQFYNQDDLNQLEFQFAFIATTGHTMGLFCQGARNELAVSCEKFAKFSPLLNVCISNLDAAYARVLRVL